jgi:hypothetical protein
MTFILLVLKEWKVSLIVLLSTLLLISIICISQIQNAKDKVKNEFDNYITTVEKQNLININKQKQKEIEILTKQKEVEVNYNEQIKALSNDVAVARNSANSLSKQLTNNASKLSTASKTEVDAYNKSISVVLEDSTRKYLNMAGEADAKRLAEERCVGLYNALVDSEDGADNPDANNKE